MSAKYYFLRQGDIILESDEYKGWNPDCTKMIWIEISKKEYSDIIGKRRTQHMAKIRRKRA